MLLKLIMVNHINDTMFVDNFVDLDLEVVIFFEMEGAI